MPCRQCTPPRRPAPPRRSRPHLTSQARYRSRAGCSPFRRRSKCPAWPVFRALRVSSGSSPRSRSHSCSSRCPCRSPCRCRTGRSRRRRGSCSRARNRHRGSAAGRPAHRACRFRSRPVAAVQLRAAIGGQDHVWRAGLAPGDAIRMAPAFAAELAIAAVMVLAAFALVAESFAAPHPYRNPSDRDTRRTPLRRRRLARSPCRRSTRRSIRRSRPSPLGNPRPAALGAGCALGLVIDTATQPFTAGAVQVAFGDCDRLAPVAKDTAASFTR